MYSSDIHRLCIASHLAYYYLRKNTKRDSLKALVIMGSMGKHNLLISSNYIQCSLSNIASFNPLPATPFYTASKHAVYGFMRALKPEFDVFGLRVVTVCPWFTGMQIPFLKHLNSITFATICFNIHVS